MAPLRGTAWALPLRLRPVRLTWAYDTMSAVDLDRLPLYRRLAVTFSQPVGW